MLTALQLPQSFCRSPQWKNHSSPLSRVSKVLKADLRWFSRDLWAQCTSMLMLDLFSDGWMQLVSILRRIPRRCIHLFPLPLLVLRILRTTTTDIGSAIFSHHRNPHSLFLPHSCPADYADPSRESG